MPILDDQDNPASSNTKLTLAEVLNSFAFLLKNITGKDSWKIPPGVSLADLAQNQGLPGETGPQGIQGEKGDKGDPGEPAPLDHQHAIADVSGLQTALDSKSAINIITSASVPSNPTQGLVWNEIDSNGNLLEQWNWINNKWFSNAKIIPWFIFQNAPNFTFMGMAPTAHDLYVKTWESQFYFGNTAGQSYTLRLQLSTQPNDSTTGLVITDLGSWTTNAIVQNVVRRSNVVINQFYSTNFLAAYFRYVLSATGTTPYQYHLYSMINCHYVRR
jgi:hypothetical protein